MSDILLQWDSTSGYGDWSLVGGDIEPSSVGLNDLETAVLISIFTDRVADAGFVVSDGSNDRRKWWAEDYLGSAFGSRLWELFRAKITNQTTTLLMAQNFVSDSLQWLITDGIAASVDVNTFWNGRGSLGIIVTITEPTTPTATTFNYSVVWSTTPQV